MGSGDVYKRQVLQVSSIGHKLGKLVFAQTILALSSRETTLVEMSLCLALNICHGTLPVMLFTNLPFTAYDFYMEFPLGCYHTDCLVQT